MKVVTPVDGSVYAERALASVSQVEKSLSKAAKAQRAWRQATVAERISVVGKMVSWCVERADRLGEELAWQMGRPVAYAPNEIRRGFQERAFYMAGVAEEVLSDIRIEGKDGFQRFIRREPLGVALVVAPWNYPWLTSVNAIVP
ncbi:MAG TPA: aldehyde dehydrogenase family protein, partial [Burkholderiales bacterium]|nr:aldehyde dehydrogenase family protein [Burkholderiales bacterium]